MFFCVNVHLTGRWCLTVKFLSRYRRPVNWTAFWKILSTKKIIYKSPTTHKKYYFFGIIHRFQWFLRKFRILTVGRQCVKATEGNIGEIGIIRHTRIKWHTALISNYARFPAPPMRFPTFDR